MAQPGDWTLSDVSGANNPQTLLYLDCQGIKAQGFLCSGSIPRGIQLKMIFFYHLVRASGVNFFKDKDIQDSLWKT